jgi:hypothetical protein
MRVRRYVEILRVETQKQVTDCAPDEKSLIAGVFEPVQDLEGVGRDLGSRDRVLATRDYSRAIPVRWSTPGKAGPGLDGLDGIVQ